MTKGQLNELEKAYNENAELRAEFAKKANTNHSLVEQMADLESENAELKRLRCCENCKNVNLQLHWQDNKEIDKQRMFKCGTCGNRRNWEYGGKTIGISETQQLTKAIEIIKDQKELLDTVLYGAETLSDFAQNTLRKAEQFLSEVENDSIRICDR